MNILLSLALAIIPALLVVVYFRRKDRARPEPRKLSLKIFFLGVLSIIPALFLELGILKAGSEIGIPAALFPLFKAFAVAALVEEGLKLFILKRFAARSPHFDEVMDGIVYGVLAGMGFACLENILYVLGTGMAVAVARAFTSIPMHAAVSGLMGYYIGLAKFADDRGSSRRLTIAGFMIAFLLHGLYDLFIFAMPVWGNAFGLGILPVLIISLIMLRRRIRAALKEDLETGRIAPLT